MGWGWNRNFCVWALQSSKAWEPQQILEEKKYRQMDFTRSRPFVPPGSSLMFNMRWPKRRLGNLVAATKGATPCHWLTAWRTEQPRAALRSSLKGHLVMPDSPAEVPKDCVMVRQGTFCHLSRLGNPGIKPKKALPAPMSPNSASPVFLKSI